MNARRSAATLAAASLAVTAALVGATGAQAAGSAGAVYVLGNQAAGNAVVVLDRAADGTLTPAGTYPTTGLGTGGGLGSQGAVVLDGTGTHLYAVDAGSDEITSFRVTGHGLERIGTVDSQGDLPISVTVHEDRLYVLNAGGSGGIAGFRVDDGALAPLAASTRPLSGTGTNPAQVSFTPDGSALVVTEKATSLIDVFHLDGNGVPTSQVAVPSNGAVPFGFDFDNKGHLVVSEAPASSASSYDVTSTGLETISASVPNNRAAACWLVVTSNGKLAFTGNAGGSLSVSSYRVGTDGSLTLADGVAGVTTAGVVDLALDASSHHLYARLGNGSVASFSVEADGGLTELGEVPALPAGAVGIAAR